MPRREFFKTSAGFAAVVAAGAFPAASVIQAAESVPGRKSIGIHSRKASPEDTYGAVAAALKAGADGLILSRKYSEMQLANLAAAGRAVRDATK